MPGLYTAKDHFLWAQRIKKEEVNAKVNPDSFSVRAAIRSEDVPRRFKPGHVDPTKSFVEEGLDPASKLGEEFKSRLLEASVPLRGRLMFPETCAQDHGWFQKDPAQGSEQNDRTTTAGALPRFSAGIGWIAPPSVATTPKANAVSKGHRAASHGSTGKRTHSLMGKGGHATGAHAQHRKFLVTGHPSLPGGSILTLAGRSASASELHRGAWGRSTSEAIKATTISPALEEAMDRSRMFMNRHAKNQWYRPLGNSDVSQFVDAYTKCWGVQLYGKASAKGT